MLMAYFPIMKTYQSSKLIGASIAKFQLGERDDKTDINYLDHKRVKYSNGERNIT